jgi:hypothetical protein
VSSPDATGGVKNEKVGRVRERERRDRERERECVIK